MTFSCGKERTALRACCCPSEHCAPEAATLSLLSVAHKKNCQGPQYYLVGEQKYIRRPIPMLSIVVSFARSRPHSAANAATTTRKTATAPMRARKPIARNEAPTWQEGTSRGTRPPLGPRCRSNRIMQLARSERGASAAFLDDMKPVPILALLGRDDTAVRRNITFGWRHECSAPALLLFTPAEVSAQVPYPRAHMFRGASGDSVRCFR